MFNNIKYSDKIILNTFHHCKKVYKFHTIHNVMATEQVMFIIMTLMNLIKKKQH